jgi:squalene cyclase
MNMSEYLKYLKYSPITPLLESKNEALIFFARRDLLDEKGLGVEDLWEIPEALKILKRQREDGSWKYPEKSKYVYSDQKGYDQLETFRQISYLIEKYSFNKNHPSIVKAAEYLFSFQTDNGDFRGIYGTQYATTYSPMISELLIKAGYENDTRVLKSLDWLLQMRQDDGGWAIPLRTVDAKFLEVVQAEEVIEPDRTKPFSHLITGCALRALSAHPDYQKMPETTHAGRLLMSRFFKRDKYADRSAVSFWTGFSYPYWFTDLLTSIDSLSKIGFSRDEPEIETALNWFINHQSNDGTWVKLKLLRGQDKQQYLWITLQISRVFKRHYS